MSHVVDFFYNLFGVGGNIIVSVIFIICALLGLLIAMRGNMVISGIISFFAAAVGIIAGAMAGLLIFDSFIIMVVGAFAGGVLLLLLVHFFEGIGCFIGIGTLAFFIAFTVTSELYINSTQITESTLMLIDIIIGIAVGIIGVIKSDYIVTAITAAAGGMITAITSLALFGVYFADIRMWAIAAAVAAVGVAAQLKAESGNTKKKRKKGKHTKKRK